MSSKFKLYKKHFNHFVGCCKEFQQNWGVNGWSIEFEHCRLEDGDYAQVITDYGQHAVMISLNREWDKEPTDDEIKSVAKHEMLHVVMGKMRGVALSRFVSEDEVTMSEHDTVNILDKIIT